MNELARNIIVRDAEAFERAAGVIRDEHGFEGAVIKTVLLLLAKNYRKATETK